MYGETPSKNFSEKKVSDISEENELIFKKAQYKSCPKGEDLPVTKKLNDVMTSTNGNLSIITERNYRKKEMIFPEIDLESNCDILGGSKDQIDFSFNFEDITGENDINISPFSDHFFPTIDFNNLTQNVNQINKNDQEKIIYEIKKPRSFKEKNVKHTKKRKREKGGCNHKKPKNNNNKIRRLKLIFCNSIWKFINNVISKVYNYNIGHYINQKQLLQINHKEISNIRRAR